MRTSRWQRPLYGPFRKRPHTGVPADHFRPAQEMTAFGDGVTVLLAHGLGETPEPPEGSAEDIAEMTKARVMAAVHALPEFASDAATSLIVTIDAAVDELMEELGIGDDDSDEAVAAAATLALRRAQMSEAKLAMLGPADPTDPLASVHGPFTGSHAHSHAAYGSQGGDASHFHVHSHDGNASHKGHHGAQAADLPERSGPSLHNLSIDERRRVDPDNEVTDPEQLAAMVASAFAARGGTDAWSALRTAKGLTASMGADGKVTPAPWHGYVAVEGIRTDDGRELCAGAVLFPDLPMALRLLIEDGGGHWGAVTCGRCDSLERQDGVVPTRIYGEGVFGSDDNGQLAELLVTEQTQRFLSIDPRPDFVGEVVEVTISTGDADLPYGYVDPDDIVVDTWLRIQSCTIGAVTIVPIPAYPQCVITLASVDLPEAPIANASAPPGLPTAGVTAAGGPVVPKREWFDNPGFHVGDPRLIRQKSGGAACPSTVSDDGTHVYGHIGEWKTPHTAGLRDERGRPRTPPHSRTNYAYFLTGSVVCDDGTELPVGNITFGCGHAPIWKPDSNGNPTSVLMPLGEVLAHYDGGYGAVVMADINCGEDDFGIWFAGAMRPGLTDEQVRAFRATNLSGDWRDLGGDLDLVATLAGVPVAGFPISRRAVTAAGTPAYNDGEAMIAGMRGDRCVALIAAGVVRRVDPLERLASLERHCEALEGLVEALGTAVRPLALERARALL